MKQEFNIVEFRNGINRALDDTGCAKIPAGTLAAYGHRDWSKIRSTIEEWKRQGLLQILCDPETSAPDEPCVEMYAFVGRSSSIPNFLNSQTE